MSKGVISTQGLDGHSADEETLMLLYGLVRYLKPALIVEAGTYKGHAALTMGLALRDGGIDGAVWTADVKDYGAVQGVLQNDLQDYVQCYLGDFTAMLNGPLKDRTFRFAFIDSGLVADHSDKVAPDIRSLHASVAYDLLAAGGVMVVDDMASEWTGVDEIRKRATMTLKTGRGMVLVQR